MGTVKEFEIFHGAVLTALVRRDEPLSLSMIETQPSEAWSTYRINDSANLLVKHSTNRVSRQRNNATVWQFTFSPAQMKQLRKGPAWAALVCGSGNLKHDMEVCLLSPEELRLLLEIESDQQQSLTIKDVPRQYLRASSGHHEKEILIPRIRYRSFPKVKA